MNLMSTCLLAGALLSAGAVPSSAEAGSQGTPGQAESSLALIKPGMTEGEISAALGAPKGRAPTPWGDIIVTWELSGPSGSRQVRYVFGADGKMLRMVPPAKPSQVSGARSRYNGMILAPRTV